MTHYEKERWILYKDNLLEEEEMIEMEEHLYTCDRCMDTFLSLIDSEELSLVETSIPIDFTDSIMQKIDTIIPITKPSSKANIKTNIKTKTNSVRKKKMIENIFMYYGAVASVVLVLTAGGVFTKITEFPIANIEVDIERTNEGLGNLYNISEKITNRTNNFINNIGNIKDGTDNGKNKQLWKQIKIKKQGGK